MGGVLVDHVGDEIVHRIIAGRGEFGAIGGDAFEAGALVAEEIGAARAGLDDITI